MPAPYFALLQQQGCFDLRLDARVEQLLQAALTSEPPKRDLHVTAQGDLAEALVPEARHQAGFCLCDHGLVDLGLDVGLALGLLVESE